MTDTVGFGATMRAYSASYWGLVLASAPCTVLAILIHRHTHHRPLGAVTFVLVSSGLLLVSMLVARRCKQRGGALWQGCRLVAVLSLLAMLAMLAAR